MKLENRQKALQWVARLAAGLVVVFAGLLVIDYLSTRYQSPADKALVESMEEAVQTDANVSVELTAERERQTERSLYRNERNLRYGYLLLISAAIFLIFANWYRSFEAEAPLPKEELVGSRHQFPVPPEDLVSLEMDGGENSSDIIDLAFVEEVIEREGRGKNAAIPVLRAIQTHYGYLPDEALQKVCEETEITPAQIAGTSTFYSQFRLSPVGKHIVKLCHGTACHVSGISQINDELRRYLAIAPGEDTDPARLFTLEKVACLGCCSLAPVIMIDEETAGRLTPVSACRTLHDFNSKRSE